MTQQESLQRDASQQESLQRDASQQESLQRDASQQDTLQQEVPEQDAPQQDQQDTSHHATQQNTHEVDTTERDQRRAMEKEQAYLRKQMKGLLPLNLGALFMPPIWGPAHGIWITILFYPLWLFADNLFYAAFTEPTTLTTVCAILVFIGSVAVTVVFAWVGQRYAFRRALTMGKTKEEYQKRQRIWAVCMALVAIVFIALATWYNLDVRPFIEFPEA